MDFKKGDRVYYKREGYGAGTYIGFRNKFSKGCDNWVKFDNGKNLYDSGGWTELQLLCPPNRNCKVCKDRLRCITS